MHLKSSRLEETADQARPAFLAFCEQCERRGIALLIVRAWSSLDTQFKIWKIGRIRQPDGTWIVADPKSIRTKARPGASPHNVVDAGDRPASLAIDIIPVDAERKPLWLLPNESAEELRERWMAALGSPEEIVWTTLYEIAIAEGLDPLGDPRGAYLPWDKGHIQVSDWRTKMREWELRLPQGIQYYDRVEVS